MLHTVNKTPFQSDSLTQCLKFAQAGDPILLIEDGVYAAQAGGKFADQLKEVSGSGRLYALEGDLKARGINRLLDGVKVIGYEGFVELVEDHQVNTWL